MMQLLDVFSFSLLSSSFQAFFFSNAAAHSSRKFSPRVTNENVQKAESFLEEIYFSPTCFLNGPK